MNNGLKYVVGLGLAFSIWLLGEKMARAEARLPSDASITLYVPFEANTTATVAKGNPAGKAILG
ncbi:MAG: hypothetical protein NC911_04175, partial [Candidatus Omnitrophica bacterium]|nr:hypothetical protein [Candidatus Omnitrophota bacterium]